jgi:hypothetical protein
MWGWAEKLFTGVDLEAEQKRSDDLDKQLLEQNQKALERGVYTEQQFEESNGRIEAGAVDVDKEVGAAFAEGLNDGVNNVRNTIGDVATSPFQLISWKLWIVGAIALFFYMGGAGMLKGILKKS